MKMNTTSVLLGLAFTVTPMYAQTSAPAEAVQPEQLTAAAEPTAAQPELAIDPQIVRGKLENGLRYLIRPTKEPAGRASVRLYVATGSLDEQDETSGISHFLEHMVFNGSRHFKRGELIPAMQKLGLGFGGDANAYTALEQTVYMLDLPNLKDETVNFAFTIMRDFADGATLEDDAIDHERGIIVSELKSRDSRGYRTTLAMLDQLAEGTRVAKFMPIGREEVIRNAPYELFRKYYRENYVPGRMTVVVTGDFEPATAEAWVRKHFESMTATPEPTRPDNGKLTNDGPSDKLIPNEEQANISIMASVVNPWQYEADTFEQRVKDFPMELACQMLNNRLSRIAQRADSPFLNAEVSESDLFKLVDTFGFTLTAHPDKWKVALATVEKELRQAIKFGFEPHEYQETLSAFASAITHATQSWETVTAPGMADRLVAALKSDTVPTTPVEDMRVLKAALEYISANPDCCREALKAAFDYKRVKLTMAGAIPEGTQAESLRGTFEESAATPVQKPDLQAARPFAYDNIGEPGQIVKKEYIEDLGVTTLTLSNGIRVNLKPVDFRKGSLTVSAAIDGGSMYLPPKPGLGMVANNLIGMSALEAHDLDELKRIMMGHNVDLNFNISDRRISISGGTTQDDLELQCKLIVANVLHPGYKPEALALLHTKLPGFYRRLTSTPDGAYTVQSAKALYGDDPRFNVPTMEEVKSITVDDVRNAITPFLQKGAMEVTLVGDFDLEATLPIIERTFGAMPARNTEFTEPTEAQRTINIQPWGQRKFFPYQTDLDKTIVTQVRPAGNGMDRRRNRRLTVLCSIARSRLFDGIRAEMGETYSPSVQLEINQEYADAATITAASAGVKGNREKVSAAMDSILTAMGSGDISQEDFDCAIRPIIASAEKGLRQNSFWCGSLAALQSDPEQADLIRDLLPDLRSITLEEIKALAKEVFGKDNANFYFTMPEAAVPAATEPAPEAEPTAPQAAPAPEAPAAEPPPAPAATGKGADMGYVIVTTTATLQQPEWRKVITTLAQKYPGAQVTVVEELSEAQLTHALRSTAAHYAAVVLRPEETGRVTVNNLHRAARKVDDDMWGDCLWGIVTGYSAEDALRIAAATEPLVIKRLLGTTNVGWHPFEASYCITDWTGAPVLKQEGYTEPTTTTYGKDTPEGQHGLQGLFAEQLSKGAPQLVVTSSHATQYNLEMPFSRGLIFPSNNRFYQLPQGEMYDFGRPLSRARRGDHSMMAQLAEKKAATVIEPDGQPRVWLAAGNCLFGDTQGTNQSMAITALSAYTCNQVVGYTVPSWYGAGGWGTFGTFLDMSDNTTLAEAWYLNNQFILHNTHKLHPELLNVRFDGESVDYRFHKAIMTSGVKLTEKEAKDVFGLVHDRDVVAFYGDPAWSATIDSTHASRSLACTWQGCKSVTITANRDYMGRLAIWFPTTATGKGATGCDAEDAVYTNDFILFPVIEMKQGETRTVNFR